MLPAANKLPLVFALLLFVPFISVVAPGVPKVGRLPSSSVGGRGSSHGWKDLVRDYFLNQGGRDYSNEGGQSNSTTPGLSSSSWTSHAAAGDGGGVQEDHVALHVSLGIGTPVVNITLVFDTTSDLLWTQCQPCLSCLPQAGDIIYDPTKSKTFTNLTNNAYNYTYSKEAFTSGYLATDTFTLGDATVSNFTFGCGTRNQGYYDNVAGVVGFGRGKVKYSFLNQLGLDRFSYCFSPSGSVVFLGESAALATNTTTTVASTPMVANAVLKSGYFVKLLAVTVGRATRVDVAAAHVIDSTSPVTFLDEATYAKVRTALVAQLAPALKEASAKASAGVGLDLCFDLAAAGGATATAAAAAVANVTVTLHFDGGDLVVFPVNYLAVDTESGLLCLMMKPSKGVPVLGNWVLMDTLVVYDLAKNVVSFQPLDCAALLAA
uniref:Peptidase A1 domain-containing protein n=1 Tax=Leersia perrieri TaxID=77586 RepID=A0A0D9XGL8_9ORYZ